MEHTHAPDDEIDLLDLLVTIAENIKLLILGPLLAGLLAFVGLTLWPSTYTSGFTLQGQKKVGPDDKPIELLTPAQVNQLITSPAVLADAAKVLQSSGQSNWAALLQSGAVSSQVPRNTTHVQVTVKTQDGQAAQAVALALLKATQDNSQPKGDDLKALQTVLEKDQAALATAKLMEARISATINSAEKVDPVLAQAYMTLLDTLPSFINTVEVSELNLKGLTDADVVSPPAPATVNKPNAKVVTAVAILATGFALLLWVFVRKAFQGAAVNPESAAKLARIRQALGWRASKV
jgi:uncharacterized protein involved in exopolysaccharide biosynthesis